MEIIEGGVCAPKGFFANGAHVGIRKNKDKKDLAIIVCEKKCTAGSCYTTNLVKGAPIYVTQENLKDGVAQAIICNSGNANTCNANGEIIARQMCDLVAKHSNIKSSDVIVASTGVIGQPLSIEPIASGMNLLFSGLGKKSSEANQAIMTTDTEEKTVAVSFKIDGKECRLGGIAKGSGMIHPNMATMLVFLTTDVNITSKYLQKAISKDVENSFNMISVDGDTSTNDMLSILASGLSGNELIDSDNENYEIFYKALNFVTTALCKKIAKDGEGATKLLEANIQGGKTEKDAKIIAKSIITSSLFKTAMFGSDANWGRVLCAIGYSGAVCDILKVKVEFESQKGKIIVCENGAGVYFDESIAKEILMQDEIKINITLGDGDFSATAWGCDLTYDYVKINGDYRT